MTGLADCRQQTGKTSKSAWLVAALAFSMLAHLALLLGLPGQSAPEFRVEPGLGVTLLSVPPSPAPATDEAVPDPAEQLEPEDPATDPSETPTRQPDPVIALPAAADQTEPESIVSSTDEAIQTSRLDSRLILEAIRENGRPDPPPRRDHAPLPRLPDAPGWINDHVGTVTRHTDQWVNADGSSQARIVTGSGQIYCGRNDPPSMGEIFNPQFSLNVMRWRNCGRESPEPVDRSDPWLRAPH